MAVEKNHTVDWVRKDRPMDRWMDVRLNLFRPWCSKVMFLDGFGYLQISACWKKKFWILQIILLSASLSYLSPFKGGCCKKVNFWPHWLGNYSSFPYSILLKFIKKFKDFSSFKQWWYPHVFIGLCWNLTAFWRWMVMRFILQWWKWRKIWLSSVFSI